MTDFATLGIRVDSKGVVVANNNLDALTRKGGNAERATKNLTKAFKVGAVAAAAFAGFAATKSIRDISNFTQAIANLSAITGATGKDLAFYAESAKEIGKTTSLSASQAAEAFKLIASAKPDLLANAAALEEVTKSAVTLAEAAGIELPEAAKALGSALNQFGLDADKASEVINVLAASSKLGAAEIPSVTEALRNVGSAANALGVDLTETVAGIQALAIAGKQGADAGTSLRQVLLRLEKTADKNLQPSIVGLSGALENLKTLNLSNAELMKLFGDEAFAVATALLEQSDNVSQLNKNLRDTNTATEQASIRMDTLEGDSKELASAVEGLSIEFGEKLEPALREATQGLTSFINEITKLISGKSSIKDLEAELQTLELRLENSTALRGGKASKSALRSEIEEIKAELLLAKVAAGDFDSIGSMLASKRLELKTLNDLGPTRGGFKGQRGSSGIDTLTAQVKMLESALESARKKREELNLSNLISAEDQGSTPKTLTPSAIIDVSSSQLAGQVASIDLIKNRYDELLPISQRLNQSLKSPLEIYRDEITLLNELKNTRSNELDEALISQENYTRGVIAAQDRLDASTLKATDTFDALKSSIDGWGASFAEAMVNSTGSFNDFANNMILQLQKIAIQKASQPVFDAFGSSISSFIPSFAGGGSTGNGSRSGGVDGMGGFNAILHPNETVIDHTRGQSAGSNSTSIVVNVDASGSKVSGDNDGKQLGNMIGIAVRSVLIDESRPGGMLA